MELLCRLHFGTCSGLATFIKRYQRNNFVQRITQFPTRLKPNKKNPLGNILKMRTSINHRIRYPYRGAIIPSIVFSSCLLIAVDTASAASFNISNASTTKQTLAAGDTGTVTSTGSLTVT